SVFFLLALFGVCHSASAASLYLSPSSGDYLAGQAFPIVVYVSSADQAMNAASGTLNFSNNLEIISLSKSGSIFSLWVQEPSYSNAAGTVSFEGIVLNPGFTGANGKLLTINFKAKSIGEATLNFNSGSVLANDGLGTNILASLGSAKFDINATKETVPETKPTPAPAAEPKVEKTVKVPAAPIINSSTHPDQNAWYKDNNPTFTWNLAPDIIADRLLYDKFPNSQPQVNYSPAVSKKLLADMDDGTWYFHVQLKNSAGWGSISHYRFQIDSVAPESVSVKLVDGAETVDPQPKILLSADDALSGIDHWKLSIDKGDPINVSLSELKDGVYALPVQAAGSHAIAAIAYDKAGNSAKAMVDFIELGLLPPTITDCPQAMPSGKTLTVKGITYPNSAITVWLQKSGEAAAKHEAKSGPDGNFSFTSGKLTEGNYALWAEVTNDGGVKSGPSGAFNITVTPAGAKQTVRLEQVYLPVIAILLTFIFILIVFIALLWNEIRKLRIKYERGTFIAKNMRKKR
ncbi:MAG: cohesin domain-containing protein, partial [Parcubacteria group bacterium]